MGRKLFALFLFILWLAICAIAGAFSAPRMLIVTYLVTFLSSPLIGALLYRITHPKRKSYE